MKIILAITGSIAAVRCYELIRAFQNEGYSVQCVLSKGGEHFVSRLALEAISQNSVLGPSLFSFPNDNERDVFLHINIVKTADAIVIAPASANTIAKIAHGCADDFLQNMLLANTHLPVIMAPAMNEAMWRNKATQENVKIVQKRKIVVIPPQKTGMLACGKEGEGKMAQCETIVSFCKKAMTPQKYAGKKVLISLGGTQEYIDPVRFLGNASSGKTGMALANAFFLMGAEVFLVIGNVSVPWNADIFPSKKVCSTKQMLHAMQENLPKADIVIFCSAVADYTPSMFSEKKLEKNTDDKIVTLSLQQTVDIAQTLKTEKKENQIFIGFCLASEETLKEKMIEKMNKKGFDAIIGNSEQNLGSDFGTYLFCGNNKEIEKFEGEKNKVMMKIAERMAE